MIEQIPAAAQLSLQWIATQLLLVLAFFGVTIMHFFMEPLRWNICYLPRGRDPHLVRRVRDSLFCTGLATYMLPFKLGVPLRVMLLNQSQQLTLRFIGTIVTVDGIISLITWTVVALACAWISALRWHPPWYLSVAALAALVSALGIALSFGWWKKKALNSIRVALADFDRPFWRVSIAAGIVFADVISYGVRHALILLLVTGNEAIAVAGGAAGIVATYAGLVSGLPMGLVGYDATLIALLALLGVNPEQSAFVVIINRLLNLSSAILLGVPAAARLGLGSGLVAILKHLKSLRDERH